MSGHSKWATIKHKKGALDAKRGKAFSKISKELMVAARSGGGDPDMNPTLRTILRKAKAVNMPADNIERAIKKGTGELEGATFEEIMYEGYVGGGVGMIVICLTDNKNRTASEVRHVFTKNGSSFAAPGSVARGFERKGQIFIDAARMEEEKLMEVVLNAGADDLQKDGDQFEILTSAAGFGDVTEALEKAGIKTSSAEVSMVPMTMVPVTDASVAQSILRFVAALEDNDDVQNVYTNMDISDEMMQKIEDAGGE